jgi:hypothetical protein
MRQLVIKKHVEDRLGYKTISKQLVLPQSTVRAIIKVEQKFVRTQTSRKIME